MFKEISDLPTLTNTTTTTESAIAIVEKQNTVTSSINDESLHNSTHQLTTDESSFSPHRLTPGESSVSPHRLTPVETSAKPTRQDFVGISDNYEHSTTTEEYNILNSNNTTDESEIDGTNKFHSPTPFIGKTQSNVECNPVLLWILIGLCTLFGLLTLVFLPITLIKYHIYKRKCQRLQFIITNTLHHSVPTHDLLETSM
jgi:hypothetical protein